MRVELQLNGNAWPFPVVTVNPSLSDHLYVAYADKGEAAPDKADIYFVRSTDGGATWTTRVRVNSVTNNDQWQPVMTVKPDGSKVFIAWYDRRGGLASNSMIRTYGVFASLPVTNTLSFATNFALSTVDFPPAFTGTNTLEGTYDPAYPPPFPCLNDSRSCGSFAGHYAPHMGDYDTAVSDSVFVYYTWGDNRRTCTHHGVTRNQADVRLLRLSWPP